MSDPNPMCIECGKLRGTLSMLCADCLKKAVAERRADLDERYRMQDTMDGDRERMESVRNSDGRFYHERD